MQWIALMLLVVGVLLLPLSAGTAAPSAKSVAQGKQLLDKYGCNHCHIVEGKGGTVAPPLDGIGAFLSKKEFVDRLVHKPKLGKLNELVPQSLMDHVGVPPRKASLIADYVLSLKSEVDVAKGHGTGAEPQLVDRVPLGMQFVPHPKSAESQDGARVYWTHGCIACHSIGPVGGELGPNLAGIGARRSQQYIENRILKGATLLPKPGETAEGYAMPPQEICPDHAHKLAEFLMTLPPDAAEYEPHPVNE